MSSQLEKAEREAKLEAERQAKTASMHKRFSLNALDEDKAPFVPPPPPPPPPGDGPLAHCLKACLPTAPEPTPLPFVKKGSSRQTISEGIQDLGHQLEDELMHEQEVVAKTRVQVQRDFLAVAKFVPIENATRLGAEEGARVRKQMWELLCSQVESGLGTPNDGQLMALW